MPTKQLYHKCIKKSRVFLEKVYYIFITKWQTWGANIDGDTDYVGITDIHIRANENPTHNPSDRNLR